MKQTVRKRKKFCGLVGYSSGLSVGVTGLSVIVYGLSVVNFPDSRTETLNVPDWPGKVIGLSGTFTDRPAKVTDCTVCFPGQFVLTDKPVNVIDRTLSKLTGLLLGG